MLVTLRLEQTTSPEGDVNDVPIVASGPERTWIWSDPHLSDPSVLLGWGRPFRSIEEWRAGVPAAR